MRVARRAPALASLLLAIGALMPVGSIARIATVDETTGLSGRSVADAPTPAFVQVGGTHLIRYGQPFRLRGAAIYGTSNPGGPASASQVLGWAAAANLNTIRIVNMFDESGLDPGAPTDETNWARTDQLLADIADHGMVAILDLSAFRNHLVRRDIRLHGWDANCLPAADRSPVVYADVSPYRAGLASEWQAFIDFVTTRVNTVTGATYRDDPTIAVISIAGEPLPPASEECGKATDTAELTDFYERTLGMLAADDSNHLRSTGGLIHLDWVQLYGGGGSGIDGQAIFALADNTLPALHTYPPQYAADGTPIDYQTPVYGPYATGLGKPWFTEEFGWTQDVGDATRAAHYAWLYDEQRTYGSSGALFWNLGPEVAGGSHDTNPNTPLVWKAVVASAGLTELVSLASDDTPGDRESGAALDGIDISADGRYVAFMSYASTLVPDDTNGTTDIFVRDRQTNTTERVSVSDSEGQSNGYSTRVSISEDGRYVAFTSTATNLGGSNAQADVYVRDRILGTTTWIAAGFDAKLSGDGSRVAYTTWPQPRQIYSQPSGGGPAELVTVAAAGGPSSDQNAPSLTQVGADGRYVVFTSSATDLSAAPIVRQQHIWLRDRLAGTTTLVDRDVSGLPLDAPAGGGRVTADGRTVAFWSYANLDGGDPIESGAYFVRDLTTGTIDRVGERVANGLDISADGRFVAFDSHGANGTADSTENVADIFRVDRATGVTEIADIDRLGSQSQYGAIITAISADGRTVAFSTGGVLTTDDTNLAEDVYIREYPAPQPINASSPGSPTGVTAAAGDGQASVSWVAPASDGGSALTSYTVTAAPGGASAAAAANATSATIGGLANGTAYTFTVTATNAVGTGPASDPSPPATPQSGAPPPQTASETIPPAGGSATTDTGGLGPTAIDPITTSVGVPPTAGGGSVTIAETAVTGGPPTGYQFLGQQVDITSTAATSSSNPLTIVFTIDQSVLLAATGMSAPPPESVEFTRAEGAGAPAVILACLSATSPINPDPCVVDRQYDVNGDLRVTILTGTASHWNAAIKPTAVTVSNGGYAPKAVTGAQGGIVLWTFTGTKPHSVTDSLKLGAGRTPLFNSGPMTTGRFGSAFRAAGTYSYASTVKGDPGSFSGSVAVPVRISPAGGPVATSFTVTWSSATIGGYVFDVQYRFMKAGGKSWSKATVWKSGVTTRSAPFSPNLGAGTYAFSARLRNSATGVVSGWSPELNVVATP